MKISVEALRERIEAWEFDPTLKELSRYFKCSMKRVEEVADEGDFCVNCAVRMGSGIARLPRHLRTVESLYETEGEQ